MSRRPRHSYFGFLAFALLFTSLLMQGATTAQPEDLRTNEKDPSMQYTENPPMVMLTRTPPEPDPNPDDFEVRDGFKVIDSIAELRKALKRDNQKIRLKPGVYRAKTTGKKVGKYVGLFAVTGSGNHFDFRGAVIETPISTQDKLDMNFHYTHSWNIFGDGNTFESGYFRNVLDGKFKEHVPTNNEFKILGNNTTFRNCTFVIKGSFPYGYGAFYGKGGPSYVDRVIKHSFVNVQDVKNFALINSDLYQQSFGHGVHFHHTKSARIEGCNLYGTVRPTNDIIEPGKAVPKGLDSFTETNVYSPPGRYETVGPAAEHAYQIKSRTDRPIPPNEMIPLTEDGIRTYNGVSNITVKDTYVERFRHCVTLGPGPGGYIVDNVTVREAGHYGFMATSRRGPVIVRNSRGDLAFDPLLDQSTRAGVTSKSYFELTVLSARDPEAEKTFRSTEIDAPKCVGSIRGGSSTFLFRDGTARPLPERFNYIRLPEDELGLNDSVLINLTTADVRLNKRAKNSLIISAGPVSGRNQKNVVKRISFPDRLDRTTADVHLTKEAHALIISAKPAGGGNRKRIKMLQIPEPFRDDLKRAKKQGKW